MTLEDAAREALWARLSRALRRPRSLEVLWQLYTQGPQTRGALTRALGHPLVPDLYELRLTGVVATRRAGVRVYYQLSPDPLGQAVAALLGALAAGPRAAGRDGHSGRGAGDGGLLHPADAASPPHEEGGYDDGP